ncbi:hypothetical protein AUC43_11700 [Hymenobacter sedentarius]|uniref:Transposase n=1 Tax=Hymenobacter sedentarius TaxID=1411621 RepID=A0A0U4ABY8_9BACT|nr:hypothetical protein [Hymenobacter sedentarius]ALW85692.1 hypothetical protein AUC43_11700 [Hymenobacter sedentarius]
MKAYSLDLRARIAAACQRPGATLAAVAQQFSVSLSFVEKLRRRQRQTGTLAPAGGRRGPLPRLDAAARQRLAASVAARPDATLAELARQLAAAGVPAVGRTSLWQALQDLDLRRKKRVCTPPNAIPSA